MMPISDKIKQLIKYFFSIIFYYGGILSIYKKWKIKNNAVILLYHSLYYPIDPQIDYSPDGMMVKVKTFEKQMAYLSKKYNVISIDELLLHISSMKEMPQNACIITFDDGWYDFYELAYPILKKYNLPATVFLTYNYIENKEWYWEERLKFLLAQIYHFTCIKSRLLRSDIEPILTKHHLEKILILKKKNLPIYLMNLIKKYRYENKLKISQIINDLEKLLDKKNILKDRIFISWSEINEMYKNSISFGGHTLSHVNLNTIDSEEIKIEINQSVKSIKQKSEIPINSFAYPYGKFNNNVLKIIRKSRLSAACTTIGGFVNQNSDLYLLNRINIHQDVTFNKTMFACRITQFLNRY